MLLDLELTVAPTAALVSAAELREQCETVGIEDRDALLASYLAAAVGHLDGYSGILGRALAPQTWKLYLPSFPCGSIHLPLPPLISVGAVAYVDTAGAAQTLIADTDYVVITGEKAKVDLAYGKSWPSTRAQSRAVTVTFTCGFTPTNVADPTTFPAKVQPARLALKAMVAAQFEGREDWADLAGVTNLLRPLRLPRT